MNAGSSGRLSCSGLLRSVRFLLQREMLLPRLANIRIYFQLSHDLLDTSHLVLETVHVGEHIATLMGVDPRYAISAQGETRIKYAIQKLTVGWLGGEEPMERLGW